MSKGTSDPLNSEKQEFYNKFAERALALYDAAKKDYNAKRYGEAVGNFNAFRITADSILLENVSDAMRDRYTKAYADAKEKVADATAKLNSAAARATSAGGGEQSSDQLSASDLCSKIAATVTFDELAGMEREKRDIQTAFIYPMLYPALFRSQKAALMYGPPGTGKTELAKASVSSLNEISGSTQEVLFFSADGASLKGKFVGETEKRIRGTFECAAEAAGANSLSVIFMDEVDAIGGKRSAGDPNMATSVNALISSIEGVQSAQRFGNVKILSATNLPWRLDAALNRRFAQRIFVDLPNDLARMQIISNKLQDYFVIDPLMRAYEYEYRAEKDDAKRKLRVLISVHSEFSGTHDKNKDIVTAEKLREVRRQSRDIFYPRLVLKKDKSGNLFLDFTTENPVGGYAMRWDRFLEQQNKNDAQIFSLQDLIFVGMWTGLSAEGYTSLSQLAEHYQQAASYVQNGGRSAPKAYKKDYPENAASGYNYLKTRKIDTSPQPSIYGYSSSDVAKMTDQALNFAALEFARGSVRLPNGNLCDTKNRGVVTIDASCAQDAACCQLLPSDGKVCPVNLEQRKCIRGSRILLRHFVEALGRFASTVNPTEYCETVEYYLSRETIEPGSPKAFCARLSQSAAQPVDDE